MSLSFGSLRISAATAPPSMTGIIMSTIATSNALAGRGIAHRLQRFAAALVAVLAHAP